MTLPEPVQKAADRLRQGAEDYARADRSDPFTLARALTHIRVGIVRSSVEAYEASFMPETRKDALGNSYVVTMPRNMKRP